MYSRSYGKTEQPERRPFRVPPDYNGNACATVTGQVAKEETEVTQPEKEKSPSMDEPAVGFLEKLTAEDILLFVFLYSLMRGDTKEKDILGIILALLLL